jgi:hypothetical protein
MRVLCMLAAAELGVTALSPHDRASVRRRASTNVAVLVARGVLPDSALGQDTGPSYVVVCALALGIWRGVRRPGRRGREPHA